MTKQKRFSQQRQVILEVLQSTTSHPTAEWVYTKARKRLPRLSLGTIYRNLRLLTENGRIQELELGTTFSHYDGNPENHTHFMCRGCGRILDIEDPTPSNMSGGVAQDNGLKVMSHRLTFYGLCQACQKEKT
ncbi:MAG: transcriptional repressor [Dehalococcoidales bacterium]|nr:transcriptional repressor [Dehalococcoidales bacterium]